LCAPAEFEEIAVEIRALFVPACQMRSARGPLPSFMTGPGSRIDILLSICRTTRRNSRLCPGPAPNREGAAPTFPVSTTDFSCGQPTTGGRLSTLQRRVAPLQTGSGLSRPQIVDSDFLRRGRRLVPPPRPSPRRACRAFLLPGYRAIPCRPLSAMGASSVPCSMRIRPWRSSALARPIGSCEFAIVRMPSRRSNCFEQIVVLEK